MTKDAPPPAASALATLGARPSLKFFMTLRDIAMWVRSARADAAITRHSAGHSTAHAFDELYRANPDPFSAVDPRYRYPGRKNATLLSFLPARPYGHVLDLGCGVGALSRALAPHAETVTGVDISAIAVLHATGLTSEYQNVEFVAGDVSSFDAAQRQYDLIIIADVLYYAMPLDDRPALEAIARRVASCLAPGGLVLLADHYFFGFDAASRRTAAIHDVFQTAAALHHRSEHRRWFYLATLLQQGPDVSQPIAA